MIRVLQYIGSFEQGGSQAMIMNIYRGIDKTQMQFDFVIHTGGCDTPFAIEALAMGAVIYTCPSYGISTVRKYSLWWNRFFQKHTEYRIVHSHVRSTAAIVLKIAKKYGCTTIAHSHSTSSGSGAIAVIKNILQYGIRYVADYFMGCSQAAGEWLFGRRICKSSRYFNIPNAIDAEKYAYDPEIAKTVRNALGYSDRDVVIGHVGRFSEPKNHSFLIDVFAELHHQDKAYKLLLVGDGELREEIERKANRLGLSDFVEFVGVRPDVNKLMMAMDLFLFPSKWEGLPVSVVEAQASGLPCVISAAITDEVCITDLVEKVALTESVNSWVRVLNEKGMIARENTQKQIMQHGYDISQTAKWVQQFYCEMLLQ